MNDHAEAARVASPQYTGTAPRACSCVPGQPFMANGICASRGLSGEGRGVVGVKGVKGEWLWSYMMRIRTYMGLVRA